MRIPLGWRHYVTCRGEVTKTVRCSKCACKFSYQLKRSATGYALAFMWIGHGWAEDRASREAERNLEKSLAKGVDPVPCPSCGHYQLKMVWKVKAYWLIVTALIALLLITFCWWLPANAPERNRVWDVFVPGIVAAWIILGFGLAVFVGYSPNYVPIRLFRKRVGKLIEGPRWSADERGEALSNMLDAPQVEQPQLERPARGRAGSPGRTAVERAASAASFSIHPPSLADLSAAAEVGLDAEILDDAPASNDGSDHDGPTDVELAKVGKMNVECSHCHARFHAPIALEGRLIECGRCHKPFKLRRIGVTL